MSKGWLSAGLDYEGCPGVRLCVTQSVVSRGNAQSGLCPATRRSDRITVLHLSEAINYRTLDKQYWKS